MLGQLPTLTLAFWGSATLLTLLLFLQMIVVGQHRGYPLFTAYLATNLAQTAVGVALYQWYGFHSSYSYYVAWTTQCVVAIARALAAAEVCYVVLGKYKGVWALAARVLGTAGLLALCLALYFGRNSYHVGAIALEISLEACISTGIAGLFLFTRYYGIPVAPAARLLGIGLGLLSCSRILNDVVFERFLLISGTTWNYASSAVFVAVLFTWVFSLRGMVPETRHEPQLGPAHVYADVIPSVNHRLVELNAQLTRLWHLEQPKS